MTTNHLSLAQLFGKGAIQNSNVLIIQKASLLRLTPLINNTAESILTAILITGLLNFQGIITNENNQPLMDENNQTIKFDNSDAFELLKIIDWKPFPIIRNEQKFLSNQIIVSIYAPN